MKYNPLTFEFIGNACGIFRGKNGTRILCDPWIVDGVFEGSWCHYPPLETKVEDLKGVDAIYISHLHPDHFDERYFDFPLDINIIVLDHPPNFLIKKLLSLGYNNLIKIKDGETFQFKELALTCFAEFSKHNFHESAIGFLIDSALVVECDGIIALNSNDNTLSAEAAEMLYNKFGSIDLAMLNYNSAGPYPSCFNNLSITEKKIENKRVLTRNFDHIIKLLKILKPRAFLPFAGSYVLGGKESYKNNYLGTTTWDECALYIKARNIEVKTITLRENNIFNLKSLTTNRDYIPIDIAHMKSYIEKDLSSMIYPYEKEKEPSLSILINNIEKASNGMLSRMQKFGIKSDYKVILDIYNEKYQIYPTFKKYISKNMHKTLVCGMDPRLLSRIVNRISHWNNAEVGAHINYIRTPDIYQPDLHTGLQFLHI